jgi:DNA processing protein
MAEPLGIQLAGRREHLDTLLARPVVALVGNRGGTRYGREVADVLARELARAGVTVIAGLTEGVEAAAHHGALAVGGRTIAVLPDLPHVPYPESQRHLHARVLARGCAVSAGASDALTPGARIEAPFTARVLTGAPPTRGEGARRSRRLWARGGLIAMLADVTVVVEAALGSSAMRTAEAALGRTSDASAGGSNLLIRDGAQVVLEVADVLALASRQRWAVGCGR